MIKTRFAPSPTGDPHIGNIRSALFAYLFAKSQGGKFLLRIEDTDQKRLDEKSVEVIKEALHWLNIVPENIGEPMVQSIRLKIYRKAAFDLIEKDAAYVCTCSKERLEKLRQEQTAKGRPPGYDGKCRNCSRQLPENAVIRMKLPENQIIEFEDLVRGKISVSTRNLDDSIILKSDGFPTYHLAAVIDDHEMEITHVIRAEEWLPSTPKHIFLHRAFGWEPPRFAHLPVILGPNKGKLSKRDGATGILEYKKLGYLPEALINFMVLLGWNPKTEEEFFTLADLEKKFDIAQVNKSAAVFDINKLNHMNHYYLMMADNKRIEGILSPSVNATLDSVNRDLPTGQTVKGNILSDVKSSIIFDVKERINHLAEFEKQILFLKITPVINKDDLIFKKSSQENTKKGLSEALENLKKIDEKDWYYGPILEALGITVESAGLSNGDVFWPVRYAITGELKSPPPEMVATWVSKEESIKRINKALGQL